MARTDLGKWMITNGGEYDEHTTYENLTMVRYGQSTYITLKTVTGVEPTDDRENYMLMAQGFDAAALASATVEDTHGVMSDGEPEQPPAVVSAQTLIDAIADRVMNQLVSNTTLAAQLSNYIPVSKIVDNLLSTDAETVLSGKMGKQLNDAISTLNSALPTFKRKDIFYTKQSVGPLGTVRLDDDSTSTDMFPASNTIPVCTFYGPVGMVPGNIYPANGGWTIIMYNVSNNIISLTDKSFITMRYIRI